jgi:hypothetical protein
MAPVNGWEGRSHRISKDYLQKGWRRGHAPIESPRAFNALDEATLEEFREAIPRATADEAGAGLLGKVAFYCTEGRSLFCRNTMGFLQNSWKEREIILPGKRSAPRNAGVSDFCKILTM